MAKYLWYSGATDITGIKLAEALHLEGTKTKPQNLRAGDIVIGWGTKTNENVNLGNASVLNHPNQIRNNRNKFKSLQLMNENDELRNHIAKFCTANEVVDQIRANTIKFPLVGRTNFHQSGKGFWLCLTEKHVTKARESGAQYFQEYIPIHCEYRLHVLFNKVVYAVRKVEAANIEHWKEQRKTKIESYAAKNNYELDDNTIDKVLTILSKEISLPDRIVRSNRRGWKFSRIALNRVDPAMRDVAIKALNVIGLDFGAVDCAIGEDDNVYIIEVNSGPGLEGTTFDKYVAAFQTKFNEMEAPQDAPAQRQQAPRNRRDNRNNVRQNIDPEALVHMMNAVRSPEEARQVLNLMQAAA